MPETVNLAIVGCGYWTYHTHCPLITRLQNMHVRIVGLCDFNIENAHHVRRDHFHDDPSIPVYQHWEDLLHARPHGPSGVLFVTPHANHFEQCMGALDRGWDVLVEKPMVTNSDQARQIAEKVIATGRHFQIAFQAPFSSGCAYIRDLLRQGKLGQLTGVSALLAQGWKQSTVNTWRQDPVRAGGGFLYDTGAHLFNTMAWLVNRPIEEVTCWMQNQESAVEIDGVVNIRWQGGVLGNVGLFGGTPGWQEGIWLLGTQGRVCTGIQGAKLEHYDQHGTLMTNPPVTQTGYSPIENFLLCLLGRAEPRCPAIYGVIQSQLMDAIYQSATEGRPIQLQPILG